MGHGKETPRQKMIGMMYLVLTALLALNVSKEILNAFVIVNTGLQQTNDNFQGKNAKLYADFEKQLSINRAKVEPFFKAAEEAKSLAKTVYDTIEDYKIQLIMAVEGKSRDTAIAHAKNIMKIDAKDNYDIPTNFMIGDGSNPQNPELRAGRLKAQLNKFRDDLLALVDRVPLNNDSKTAIKDKLGNLGIDTRDPNSDSKDPAEKYWESSKFYHNPIVAQITIFSQLQNMVQNAESQIVTELLGAFSAEDFKFDTLAAKVIPKSTFVVSGDQYEADLFVAAFSTTDNPLIYIGEGYDTVKRELTGKIDSVPVAKGVGRLTIPASAVGNKKYSAIIKVKTPTGDYKTYPLRDVEYTVAKPMAVVSPTKMNVLYIGVDNPLDISVSGFTDDKISASISQGSLTKGSAGWNARVNTAGKCNVNVSVKDETGKARSMGSMEFRVKRVPDPVAKVAGQREGLINKELLKAQTGVAADLENFDFDLKFVVTGFKVSASIKGFVQEKASYSNMFTPEQKDLISRIDKGQKVYIEEIKAKGPDGSVRSLGTIGFKIN